MRSVWIGVAGFVGAVARYQLDTLVGRHSRGPFPWGTLLVNLSGCFLLGVLVALPSARLDAHPGLRPALAVGLLGAYTTFSTVTVQAVRLSEVGEMALAAGYVAASITAGLLAAWAGMALARAFQ